MNIAVLHPQCRVQGGAIKMALLTAQSLKQGGHNVMFYTFDHDPDCFPALQEGLTIVAVRTREKMPLDTVDKKLGFWAIFRQLFPRIFAIIGIAWDIRQVDIVIANNPPMQIVGVLAKIFSSLSSYHQNLSVIWWHHHVPWYYQPEFSGNTLDFIVLSLFSMKGWKSWFERHFIIPLVRSHVATSEYTAVCILKYCGRKAVVIHPVVELEQKPQPEKGMVGSESPRTHERPLVLFSHGRLEPGKGFDTLVKAWKELNELEQKPQPEKGMVGVGNPPTHQPSQPINLLIAGEGSLKSWLQEQGATVIPYYEGLLEEIQNTEKIEHQPEQKKGIVGLGNSSTHQLINSEPNSDILAIYLSTIDAFGICPLEAQIAGLSTIILDKGGARETVLLDKNNEPMAQLIDTEKEIISSITYFIQHKTLHKRMSNVNFCHHEAYFSSYRLDADILSLIDSIR